MSSYCHHIVTSSSYHHNLISTIMGCRDQWEMCAGMPGPTSNNASYYTHCAQYCAPSHNRHHPCFGFLFSVFCFFGLCVLFSVSGFASYYIHCAQYCEVPSHIRHHPRPDFFAVLICCYVLCRPLCAYHPPLKCFRSFYGVLICCMPLCGYAPTQRRHLSVTHKRLCSFHPRLVRKSGS